MNKERTPNNRVNILMIVRPSSLYLCLTFGLMFSLPSCVSLAEARPEKIFKPTKTPIINQGQLMEFKATVVYKTVEKGFYALDADNGRRFQPLNLPLAMRVHGSRVKVTGVIKQDMATTANYGQTFEISSILMLSKGQGHNRY
jgi:hypothetical protein